MLIENKQMDEERACYGAKDLTVKNCRFDGPADGESAFKECENINVEDTFLNLRYPFWHDHSLKITDCEMTPNCRRLYGIQIILKSQTPRCMESKRSANAMML